MTVSITFSHDDVVSGRWTGVGRPMTAQEINLDLFNIKTAVETLQANYTLTVSLSTITQPTASTLLFTLTDATTFGPFTMPVSTFRDRGDWATATVYLVNDTFTSNGSLYRVIFDHTSDPTSFSPTANDGAGHDYYASMLSSPGNALPSGGATGQILQKSSGTDYAVTWGYRLPIGGSAGQVLLKQSSTNQDAAWTTLSAGMVSFSPATGSSLTATNVADAIEQAASSGGGSGGGGSVAGLSDVVFATGDPTAGQQLQWNGTHWTADFGNFYALDDVNVSEGPGIDGYVLYWNHAAGFWEAKKPIFRDLTVTTLGTTGTVSLDPSLGNVFEITPSGGVTLNSASIAPGAEITLFVNTSGTSSFNIAFGSNFKTQGTLATGIVSGKTFAVKFVGDGGTYGLIEVSRTVAM